MPIDRLFIARDAKSTIVSLRRLRVTGEDMTVSRWGGIEARESAAQTVHPAPSGARPAVALLPPVLATGVLWAAGVTPGLAVGAGGVLFFALAYLDPVLRARRQAKTVPRAEQSGTDRDGTDRGGIEQGGADQGGAGRGGALFRTLFDEPERRRFQDALTVAESVAGTWPALAGLIDERDARWALNQALWDLADVLARHQDIRRILAALEEYADDDLPRAQRDVTEQLTTARAALRRLDEQIASREASLAAAERAGRRLDRERRLDETLRESAASIDIQAVGSPGVDTAGELAEQTDAVVQAYRELAAEHRND
ncbi:hypothetical protein [Actinoplanes sp. NPDC051851]|uniref:hypothetical protein n=1 Tax=Actinoplanes sp. NPDC051851 TaxID=3154753 RepID=UPI00341A91F4